MSEQSPSKEQKWENKPSTLHQGKTRGEYRKQQYAEIKEKKHEVAKKMNPNDKNNKVALEIDRHNRSWNGKKYTK